MGISSVPMKLLVQTIHRKNTEGQLIKSISIQRRDVWDLLRKSNFIVSLLLNVPIVSLLFEKTQEKTKRDNEKYYVIDGKQRSITISAFINDEFALSDKIKVKTIDGCDLAGLKFSGLPVELQNTLIEREIPVTITEPLTEKERQTVFFMNNQSVPLTKMELSRADIGEANMDKLEALTEHPFMQNKLKITKPARRKYQDLQVIIEYLMLKNNDDIGFTAFELATFCENIRDNPELVNTNEITEILDYLEKSEQVKADYLKKVNMPMIFMAAEQSMRNGISPGEFHGWLVALWESLMEDEEYIASCKSYKKSDVKRRLEFFTRKNELA